MFNKDFFKTVVKIVKIFFIIETIACVTLTVIFAASDNLSGIWYIPLLAILPCFLTSFFAINEFNYKHAVLTYLEDISQSSLNAQKPMPNFNGYPATSNIQSPDILTNFNVQTAQNECHGDLNYHSVKIIKIDPFKSKNIKTGQSLHVRHTESGVGVFDGMFLIGTLPLGEVEQICKICLSKNIAIIVRAENDRADNVLIGFYDNKS